MPSSAMGCVSEGSSRGEREGEKKRAGKKDFKKTASPSSAAHPGEGEEE